MSIYTISINENIKRKFEKLIPSGQRSKKIENMMRSLVESGKDSSHLNLRALDIKISKISDKIIVLKNELDDVTFSRDELKQKIVDDEEEMIKKQVDLEKKRVTCINCSNKVIPGTGNNFKKGVVCKDCYLTADIGLINRWRGK